jgi:hypothetical protein
MNNERIEVLSQHLPERAEENGYHSIYNLLSSILIHRNPGNVYNHKEKRRESSVGRAMGYGLEGQISIPGSGKVFLFSIASMSALGPTKLPRQLVPEAFPRRQSGRGVKLTVYLHIVPRSREVELYPHSPVILHGVVLF